MYVYNDKTMDISILNFNDDETVFDYAKKLDRENGKFFLPNCLNHFNIF